MTQLFAAIDAAGQIQFVGDVPRGAACGCFCPECGSPLVAKRGQVNDWHFAHEGRQERVECAAGAINMMRRLAIEHLVARVDWNPAPFAVRVRSRSFEARVSEVVEWNCPITLPWQWHEQSARHEPVASGQLRGGCPAKLFIAVSEERPQFPPTTNRDVAALIFWIYLPKLETLRHHDSARRFIADAGVLFWRHLPDTAGHVQATQNRVDSVAHERLEVFQQKWAQIQAASDKARAKETSLRMAQEQKRQAASKPTPATRVFAWAPGQKPGTSFSFYRLKDGSAWVLYQRQEGGLAVAPWGSSEEGWDEALPPLVGVPDTSLGVYLVSDMASAFTYFGSRAQTTRSDSDPDNFVGV